VAHRPESGAQRIFSLGSGVLLLVLGAAVALISARQFRQVARSLDPGVVPPGYWTQVGVILNVILAVVALAFALHFLMAGAGG
jgi:putative membrane protein